MEVFRPERIVCLTEETVETLYLLNKEDRIVGVSGYAVRPKQVRKEKPRVYFEEWDEPMISGIGWVSELIEIAGGQEVFPALAREDKARDRFVTSEQVIAAAPDVILAS